MNLQHTSKILFFTILMSYTIAARRLVLLLELTSTAAHTARSSIYEEPFGEWINKYGTRAVTPAGMRQHYLLGKQIRKDYSDFFSNVSPKDQEAGAISSFSSQTFISALAHLAGLFPKPDEKIPFSEENDPRYKPHFENLEDSEMIFNSRNPNLIQNSEIKIETLPANEDSYFSLILTNNCKINNRVLQYNEIKILEGMKDTMKSTNKIADRIKVKINVKANQIRGCRKIGFFSLSEYFSHDPEKKLDFKNDNDLKTVLGCYKVAMMVHHPTKEITKTYGSPLMIEFLQKMKRKEISELKKGGNSLYSYNTKYLLYSGFKENIFQNLVLLGVYSKDCLINEYLHGEVKEGCPEFPVAAGSLIYEFEFDDEKKKGIVSVKFNGEYLKICPDNTVENDEGKNSCYLDIFKEKMQKEVNPDWRESCGTYFNDKEDKSSKIKVIVWVLFGGILTLISIIMAVIMLKWKIDDEVVDERSVIN